MVKFSFRYMCDMCFKIKVYPKVISHKPIKYFKSEISYAPLSLIDSHVLIVFEAYVHPTTLIEVIPFEVSSVTINIWLSQLVFCLGDFIKISFN